MNTRVRSVADLVKLLRLGHSDFGTIHDKATISITVNFQSQVGTVEAVLQETFSVSARVDQSANLEPFQIGDRSILYNVSFPEESAIDPSLRLLPFQVQLRSLGQEMWAEMAQLLLRHPGDQLPQAVARRLYGLSSLLEICDREYEQLYHVLNNEPGADIRRILSILDECYYRYTTVDYVRELTTEIIKTVRPLLGDAQAFATLFESWVSSMDRKLKHVYSEHAAFVDQYALLFQPESLLLFYLLERHPALLVSEWCKRYPFEELEDLAIMWGIALV